MLVGAAVDGGKRDGLDAIDLNGASVLKYAFVAPSARKVRRVVCRVFVPCPFSFFCFEVKFPIMFLTYLKSNWNS